MGSSPTGGTNLKGINMIICISGGFDPLHNGHMDMIVEAKNRSSRLVVLLNSDEWLIRKKGKYFMDFNTRRSIVSAVLRPNDLILPMDDSDDSAIDGLRRVIKLFPNKHIVFANGGDRTSDNTPEQDFCRSNNIDMIWNMGGGKTNSSSELLNRYTVEEKMDRDWGYWEVIKSLSPECKIKTLTVSPDKHLSLQRHFYRSELWLVTKGIATLYTWSPNDEVVVRKILNKHEFTLIPVNHWHILCNYGDEELEIVEIQFGEKCEESDIERQESPCIPPAS